MWFFLVILILCFTILVGFRMYIDMRRMDRQQDRLMQRDRLDDANYQRIVELPTPKASMPDIEGALRHARRQQHAAELARKYPTRYYSKNEITSINAIDNKYVRDLMELELLTFMDEQRKRGYE